MVEYVGQFDFSVQPQRVTVKTYRKPRSNSANAKMWAMLTDIASQVEWHGLWLTKEEWKTVFTAALKRQKVVPGLEGGFVALGTSTREFTWAEMSDMIELMYSFGAEQGVEWTEPRETSHAKAT